MCSHASNGGETNFNLPAVPLLLLRLEYVLWNVGKLENGNMPQGKGNTVEGSSTVLVKWLCTVVWDHLDGSGAWQNLPKWDWRNNLARCTFTVLTGTWSVQRRTGIQKCKYKRALTIIIFFFLFALHPSLCIPERANIPEQDINYQAALEPHDTEP